MSSEEQQRTTGGTPPRSPSSFQSRFAITYVATLLGAPLALANVLVISRALGPEGRGAVAFLTAVAYLTSQLAALGVEQAVANFAASRPALRPSLATNSLFLALLLGGAAAGILSGLFLFFPEMGPRSDLRWLALASIPLLILRLYLGYHAEADYRFALTNAAELLAPITNIVVNGVLFGAGVLTVGYAFGTWVAGQALSTAVMVWYVARKVGGFGRPDIGLMRTSVRFGLKTYAGRLMTLGNYRLDQWLLGALAGTRELGLYSVAVAWSEALFYLPTALVAVQRPDLVRASRAKAADEARGAFRAATLVTIPAAAAFVAAAPLLTTRTFGDRFENAAIDLRILAAGAVGVVALKLLRNALTAQNHPSRGTIPIGVAFALTIALDLLLIPPHGGLGAALASTASYTAGGVAIGVVFTRTLGGRLVDLVPRPNDVRWLWRHARSARRALLLGEEEGTLPPSPEPQTKR